MGVVRASLGTMMSCALLAFVLAAAPDKTLEQQAAQYRDDGLDREAVLLWQALIREQPRAPAALGFQQQVITLVLRMGNKAQVVAQVERLVTMARQIDGDVSEAEPLLASVASGWSSECRKTGGDGCLVFPSAIYDAYLTLFSTAPHAYEVRFFFAELLYAMQDNVRAAAMYRTVIDRDVECLTTQRCSVGRFMGAAAWGERQAVTAHVR